MKSIVIGKSGHHNIAIDLDTLLSTRMLLTADSGGGKTFAIKRIIEQAFGKIQIIGIDPEGEFSPLREKYPFVLVGKGGETPADVRSARLVAQTILKLRANAICDLYEMKPSARHEWVRDFCDGLLEAPKEHRHPCLVIIDEAHLFAPEHGKGESVASDAVIGLCTRGRKRLLVPLFATQRLATLSKDASSMLLNRMVGGTFEDINRKRAAEVLGIDKKEMHAFYDQIKTLEPGHFFALGRAISKERVLFRVGPIHTAHGQDALKYEITPPPPPEAIAKLLPKLADLPKAAEEKARNEAELRSEIRLLKTQLRTQPTTTKEIQVTDQKAIDRAVAAVSDQFRGQMAQVQKLLAKQKSVLAEIADKLIVISGLASAHTGSIPSFPPVKIPEKPRRYESLVMKVPKPNTPIVVGTVPLNGDLKGPERRILTAMGELLSIGTSQPSKEQVAAWSSYSVNGGAFRNPLGSLKSKGLVDYPSTNSVALTEEGKSHVGSVAPPTWDELMARIEKVCSGPEWKIFQTILAHKGETIPHEQVAEETGYEANGGAFRNPLGALRTMGLIEYPKSRMVTAAPWLNEV